MIDGGAYQLVPDGLYESAQRVWLPLPGGLDTDAATLYYGVAGDAWLPGEAVAGWLEPESFLVLELNGETWLGFRVYHGGTVRVGPIAGDKASLQRSILPADAAHRGYVATLLLLTALLAGMAWRVRRGRGADVTRGPRM